MSYKVKEHLDHADYLEVATYRKERNPEEPIDSITVECTKCGEVVEEIYNADDDNTPPCNEPSTVFVKQKVRCNDCGAVFTEVYPNGLDGDESYSDPEDPKPCDCQSQYTFIKEDEKRTCKHTNLIIGSYQVGNANTAVTLVRNSDTGKVIDFEFDRAEGEVSDPVFYCTECQAELELSDVLDSRSENDEVES